MEKINQYIDGNFKKTIRFTPEDKGDLIGLPYPYTVPCTEKMFRCMYYWDTYFTNLGLYAKGMAVQARYNVNDMLYLVDKYGFMPNGNRTIYLNRSQPPFLYLMVKDVYNYFKDGEWLNKAYKTLCREYEFWSKERRADNGLNYYGSHRDMPAETVNEYNNAFRERSGGFCSDETCMRLRIAKTFLTFCESGWDCCSRFGLDGENYNPVDLNSLLYGFEDTMCIFSGILKNGEDEIWADRAKARKDRMKQLLWNEKERLYMDWNFKENQHSRVRSAASLYPMFVSMADDVAGEKKLLRDLMTIYGVACSVKDNYRFNLQWDYPNVWAPIQYVAFRAFRNYSLDEEAEEIMRRYTGLIEKGFEETGNLWEKYDGITGGVAEQDYAAPTMMGWTAGVYLHFKKRMNR